MNTSLRSSPLATSLLVALGGSVAAAIAGYAIGTQGIRPTWYLVPIPAIIFSMTGPLIGLYLMLFLEPLQYLVVFEGTTTLVRVIGVAVFIAWGALKLLKREPMRLLAGPLTAPMIVLLYVCGISVLWSDFDTWRVSMLSYTQLVMWVFLLTDLINSPQRLERGLLLLILGAAVNAGSAIVEFYQYREHVPASALVAFRATGLSDDPNWVAWLSITILPFLFFMVTQRRGWQRLMGLIFTAVSMLAIGVSTSRAGLILLGLFVVLQLITWRSFKMTGSVFILALTFAAATYLLPWDNIMYRFSAFQAEDTTLSEVGLRGLLAQAAVKSFTQKPILGYGLGSRPLGANVTAYGRWSVQIYYKPGGKMRGDSVHNQFLEMALQLGLLGLLPLAWLWVAAWQRTSKARKLASTLKDREALAFIIALRLCLFLCLVYGLAFSIQLSRLMWLIIALTEICYRLVRDRHTAETAETLLPTVEGVASTAS
jgi:O-antigen ligase